MRLLREVVAPVLTGYVVVLAMLASYRRALLRGDVEALRPRPVPTGWAGLVRDVVAMAVAGYAFFLLLVVVFYFVLGGESGTLLTDALFEGSVLTFLVALPVFFLLSWADGWVRARRGAGSRER